MTSSKKFTFDFLEIAKTSDFSSFALMINSDESQMKHNLNPQSLGENRTDGYRVENVDFSTDVNTKKVHICLH